VLTRDPRHLGGDIGFTTILHTWGQNLQFHPHVHCVVTGGGLRADDRRWIPARDRFFLPIRVLGRLFRGRFLHALAEARKEGQLAGGAAGLVSPGAWKRLIDKLYQLEWVVYAKPPFGGPEHVFRYLGRYTHRVAIANNRLLAIDDGSVTFQVRDYADASKPTQLTLGFGEFMRRFLLHVLPRGYTRIRHYGLLAPRNARGRLVRARALLAPKRRTRVIAAEPATHPPTPWWQRLLRLTGIDVMLCPYCGEGRLVREPGRLPARAPP
jgi:hypothetical protein